MVTGAPAAIFAGDVRARSARRAYRYSVTLERTTAWDASGTLVGRWWLRHFDTRTEGAWGVMKPVRLVLVDDEPAIRRGLRMRLALESDVEVVGEAANGVAALEQIRRLAPQVVLMDVEMPGLDGISATWELRSRSTGPAVVMLSIHDDAATVARALAAGAVAFVAKHSIDALLLAAIRLAAHGEDEVR